MTILQHALADLDDITKKGRRVAAVYCRACGDRRGVLAEVRRHRRWGLVYVASSAAWVERSDVDRELELTAKRHGERITAATGTCLVLLDYPDQLGDHRQERPVANCPRHGDDHLDRDELARAAQSHRTRHVVVTIHQNASSMA